MASLKRFANAFSNQAQSPRRMERVRRQVWRGFRSVRRFLRDADGDHEPKEPCTGRRSLQRQPSIPRRKYLCRSRSTSGYLGRRRSSLVNTQSDKSITSSSPRRGEDSEDFSHDEPVKTKKRIRRTLSTPAKSAARSGKWRSQKDNAVQQVKEEETVKQRLVRRFSLPPSHSRGNSLSSVKEGEQHSSHDKPNARQLSRRHSVVFTRTRGKRCSSLLKEDELRRIHLARRRSLRSSLEYDRYESNDASTVPAGDDHRQARRNCPSSVLKHSISLRRFPLKEDERHQLYHGKHDNTRKRFSLCSGHSLVEVPDRLISSCDRVASQSWINLTKKLQRQTSTCSTVSGRSIKSSSSSQFGLTKYSVPDFVIPHRSKPKKNRSCTRDRISGSNDYPERLISAEDTGHSFDSDDDVEMPDPSDPNAAAVVKQIDLNLLGMTLKHVEKTISSYGFLMLRQPATWNLDETMFHQETDRHSVEELMAYNDERCYPSDECETSGLAPSWSKVWLGNGHVIVSVPSASPVSLVQCIQPDTSIKNIPIGKRSNTVQFSQSVTSRNSIDITVHMISLPLVAGGAAGIEARVTVSLVKGSNRCKGMKNPLTTRHTKWMSKFSHHVFLFGASMTFRFSGKLDKHALHFQVKTRREGECRRCVRKVGTVDMRMSENRMTCCRLTRYLEVLYLVSKRNGFFFMPYHYGRVKIDN